LRTKSVVDLVAGILENYATRGVFRSFSQGPSRKEQAMFKLMWHHDRYFELVLDVPKHTLRCPAVLPSVPQDSSMYREFKEFLEYNQSEERPAHRRIDPAKVGIRSGNRAGNVSLTFTVKDGDYEYGARKLIHLMDEIFKAFLQDGPYYEYLVENFGVDPDKV
jgi:hypothetical protein